MKYYIIAGEASGDLHASNLMKELKEMDAQAEFRGLGGDRMKGEGAVLIKHIRELAFMGFTEVIMNLRTILRNIADCKKDIEAWKPDVVILVDYPGFNLRIARYAHEIGIRVFYYISPQVWAWKKGRVKQIRHAVDEMYCILPFEKDFYRQLNYRVNYVGHPLLDVISDEHIPVISEKLSVIEKKIIAVLPGSRKQEITRMLPVMLEAGRELGPEFHFVIAKAPSQPDSLYQELISGFEEVTLVRDQTYPLLSVAWSAMVTSGTATLEAGLFRVPQVVCYKGGNVSYQIAKRLVNIDFISLVNLIMEKEVVKELIQQEMNAESLTAEMKKLNDPTVRARLELDYLALRDRLGGPGASARTADHMWEALNE